MKTANTEYRFGPFRFDPARQLLSCDGVPVHTSRRALEVLAVLLERPGTLVGKDALMRRIWGHDTVQEGNLKVQMAKLRKALGDDARLQSHYIATVNGRGYRFVAALRTHGPAPEAAAPQPFALPAPLGGIVGRAAAVDAVLALFGQRRLVNIVGIGGIGKTAVALSVAHALVARQGMPGYFLDLGGDQAGDGFDALAARVGTLAGTLTPASPMLVLLDSCEHMGDAVAGRLDALVRAVPGLQVLATSRAPLCMPGEAVYRLGPLAYPAAGDAITAEQALDFPAVALFVERAAACPGRYRLLDADAAADVAAEIAAVVDICRRLEGHPLAIRMAAGRMEAFSAAGIAASLDDGLGLLRACGQEGQARHASLAATFDWSYQALPACERRILRALARLGGPFTLDAAAAVLARDGLDADTVVHGVGELATKSLLIAALDGQEMRYRLPATIRPYAAQQRDEAAQRRAGSAPGS
nr:winged helix-turn-helix domain-containing protein [uncultured Massilia sp.]